MMQCQGILYSTVMEIYTWWTDVNNKKLIIPTIFLAAISLASICVAMSSFNKPLQPEPAEGWHPLFYELDAQKASVKVSLKEAIEKVKVTWPLPKDCVIKSILERDDVLNATHWVLDWLCNDSYVLSASVDSHTGVVTAITDFRRSGTVDNLKDREKAIELGREALGRLGIELDNLSTPTVFLVNMPNATNWKISYRVVWQQMHKGLKVDHGSVGVTIDAETLKIVGFSNGLIDVQGLDTTPIVLETEATETVKSFSQTNAIMSKGYVSCEIVSTELIIAQPNYNSSNDRPLIPIGKPTLVWYEQLKEKSTGWRIDLMIDAQNGAVVGLVQYR